MYNICVFFFLKFLFLVYQAAFLASKGLTYGNQLRWVFRRFVAYELFGFVASLLLYIPILSWAFYWTNLCGAAFWALAISRATEEFIEKAEIAAAESENEHEHLSEKAALLAQKY